MNLANFQDQFTKVLLTSKPRNTGSKKIPYLENQPLGATLFEIQRAHMMEELCALLCSVFPTVYQILGMEKTTAVAQAYFCAYPPTTAQPSEALEPFPYFLEAAPETEEFPYLPDVATIDLGFSKSYHSASVDTIHTSIFTELAPEQLASKRIRLHPACFWFSSSYAIHNIWRNRESWLSIANTDLKKPQNVILIRPQLSVDVHKIDAGLAEALDRLDSGETLDSAFTQAGLMDNSFRPVSALQFLIQNNLIMSLY